MRQLFNWDCGLACVLMVLRALGIECCDIHDLEKLCSTTRFVLLLLTLLSQGTSNSIKSYNLFQYNKAVIHGDSWIV